eukprot:scaffold66041_cov61-Phaeocystis_antarctica.AAC.3
MSAPGTSIRVGTPPLWQQPRSRCSCVGSMNVMVISCVRYRLEKGRLLPAGGRSAQRRGSGQSPDSDRHDTLPCSVTSEFAVSRPAQATTKRSAHHRDARMGGRPIYRS